MKGNRQIAEAIDLRVRQLAKTGISDRNLVDQMVGYMADLQRLWYSTTDDELEAFCDAYPGFLRYATLMEDVSRVMREGGGVPAEIRALPRLTEPLKGDYQRLLAEGATFEREFQEEMDRIRARQAAGSAWPLKRPVVPAKAIHEWSERVSALHVRIRLSELAPPAQALLLQSLSEQLRRLDALFENDARE
jgi:hypothetical protein